MATDTQFINAGTKEHPTLIHMRHVHSVVHVPHDEGNFIRVNYAKGMMKVTEVECIKQVIRYVTRNPMQFYGKRHATIEGVRNYYRLDLKNIQDISPDYESLPDDAPDDQMPTQIRIIWVGEDNPLPARKSITELLRQADEIIDADEVPEIALVDKYKSQRTHLLNLLGSNAREETLDGEDASDLMGFLLNKARIAPTLTKNPAKPTPTPNLDTTTVMAPGSKATKTTAVVKPKTPKPAPANVEEKVKTTEPPENGKPAKTGKKKKDETPAEEPADADSSE